MKKLLYVAPHLSTGGLPQYLVKKVELLKQDFEIHLVEWVDCTGGVLTIQRDKLVDLVDSDKFYTLKENKSELLDIINSVKPDIVHLEEIPEYFMDNEISKNLYTLDRDYFIVETSHDSSFDVSQKRYFPDKFMFVSQWQINQYKDLDIPKSLVEYPIEYIDRPNRRESLEKLGLDPTKKHILHIGLFTPRKNQEEFFKYAKALPEYEFHCVGNQAENFKHYWEPLMEDKPDNLTWWNERSDVDNFYQSMDLFLFTSRGTNNDKETMPLVIREALSFKIPQLLYNLPVYLNYFDKFESISYLEPNNFEENCELIKSQLSDNPVVKCHDEVFIISTYPATDSIVDTTLDCVKTVQANGYKVILTSHIPIPDVLQNQADYCVVDKNNILTKHTFYSNFYWNSDEYDVNLNLKGENNDVYHGPAVYTNYYNGAALATQLEFKKAYFLNYDYILKDIEGIQNVSKILNKKNFYFGKHHPAEGDALYTYFFASNPHSLLNELELISTGKEYDQLMKTYGAESNGLENLFHHIFKNKGAIYREEESVFESKSKEIFDHKDFSRVEYFTILPTNIPNYFAPYFYISNSKDNRTIQYKIYKNGELIINRTLNINQKLSFWDLIQFNGEYEVQFEIQNEYTSEIKKFKVDQEYFNNLSQNGYFTWKGEFPKPKIKIIHLLSQPEDEREQRSIESISKLGEYKNIEYTQIINKPYSGLLPVETCNRPNDLQTEPGYYKLSYGHYGCFKAHTDAIISCPKDDDTTYLFFECDALLLTDTKEFVKKLYEAIEISKDKKYTFFSFAHNYEVFNEYENHLDAGMFTDAHAYLIMGNKIDTIHNVINNSKWDAFDLWVTNNFRNEPKGFFKEPLVFQAKGYSLIDNKISETNIKGDKKI
jgi:glycosyltransferase involved in cell wall biosynthesis/GR25 family glycosyltransferase involved in LPS biosynthesis